MDQASVLELFRQTGAYLEGHFRLTSGLHSPGYMQCARVLAWPRHAEALGAALAARLREAGGDGAEVVVSPAIGGLIIGHEVARALGARHLFAERQDGVMTLRRGFTIDPQELVVVVEDVITTGGSTREVVDMLERLGAKVPVAGSIIDRSGGKADVGVGRVSLAGVSLPVYDPESCPLCKQGLPLVKPGSRAAA